jgi:hypothetical protein
MTALELLVSQFPGKTFISMVDAGFALGYKRQSCYNLRHANKFPLPIKMIGSKCMVSLLDVASYISGDSSPSVEQIAVKRRPGRPTKREEVERSRLSS